MLVVRRIVMPMYSWPPTIRRMCPSSTGRMMCWLCQQIYDGGRRYMKVAVSGAHILSMRGSRRAPLSVRLRLRLWLDTHALILLRFYETSRFATIQHCVDPAVEIDI